MKINVYFHKNCPDGTLSAAIAYKYLGNTATYIPIQYGDPYTLVDRTYFLDWCPPEDLRDKPNVIIIDHHKGTQERSTFWDNTKAGCQITYDYFFGTEPVPKIIKYVEDRDLWRFALPQSEIINYGISLLPLNDYVTWSRFLDDPKINPSFFYNGCIVERYTHSLILKACTNVHSILLPNGGCYKAINSSLLQSEIGDFLLNNKNYSPPVLIYFVNEENMVIFSVRGKGAYELAKIFGGGGHSEAAGFTLKIEDIK